MGRLDGKVAFITGAARGQGRSHAVRLAQEGCEIIGLDLCAQIESVGYPMATAEDLSETVRLVEEHDHRMVAVQADVRDLAQVEAVLQRGLREFGRLDIVLANAGVAPIVGGIGAGVWIACFLIFRYASVASMVAACSVPLIAVLLDEPWPVIAFAGGAAVAVVVLHRGNIARLRAGTESRFRFRRPASV